MYDIYEESDLSAGGIVPTGSCGIMLATVVENYSDEKEEKGLLAVKLSVLEDKQDIIRKVRMLRTYATGKNGFYFLPEVGDLVVVTFLGCHYSRGIVLGSLYTKKDEGRLADKNNVIKEICTKSGTAITFNDTDKKESLIFRTPKKQEMHFSDENEKITIKAKDGVILTLDGKNGEVTIESAEKLKLKCGSAELVLEKSGAFKINGKNIAIEGQNITTTAKAKLSLKGQTAEMDSKGTTSVSGGGKVEIKSSGITDLKGAMIKLNG